MSMNGPSNSWMDTLNGYLASGSETAGEWLDLAADKTGDFAEWASQGYILDETVENNFGMISALTTLGLTSAALLSLNIRAYRNRPDIEVEVPAAAAPDSPGNDSDKELDAAEAGQQQQPEHGHDGGKQRRKSTRSKKAAPVEGEGDASADASAANSSAAPSAPAAAPTTKKVKDERSYLQWNKDNAKGAVVWGLQKTLPAYIQKKLGVPEPTATTNKLKAH